MSKMLIAPGAGPRVIAPTTTRKMAQRMLSASHEIARSLPRGFYTPAALDILLMLHVAEDDSWYPASNDIALPGSPSARLIGRWLAALEAEGLIDRRDDLVALSQKGHDLVISLIETVYAAQRALD